jgi:lysophospholipase L1-like esterase
MLLLIIFLIDVGYSHFLERLPPLRGEVYLQMAESSLHQRSKIDGLFYELKPGVEKGHFKINSLSMRDDEPAVPKGPKRILIMGDSVTFGNEVAKEELFSEVAERLLNVEGGNSVEVLNAGVSCYNTKQEYIALREKYLHLYPDIVIFAFCSNDLGEAAIQYLPDEYPQRKIIQSGIRPQGLHYRSVSDTQYLSLTLPNQFSLSYNLDRWLLLHSGIYRAISILKFKMQHSVKDIRHLSNFLFRFNFDQVLRDIKKLSMDKGFSLEFVILPTKAQWDRDAVIQSLTRNGIPFWDFDSELKKLKGTKNGFWSDEIHLTPEGHAIVGRLLADKLKPLLN